MVGYGLLPFLHCILSNSLGPIWKVDGSATEELTTTEPSDVENWRRPNLPTIMWEILEFYSNVYPKSFLRVYIRRGWAMNSRLIWKMRHHPSIDHCTNSVASTWKRPQPRNKFKTCSNMDLSDLSNPLVEPLCYLCWRKMTAFDFVLATDGWTSAPSRIGTLCHY